MVKFFFIAYFFPPIGGAGVQRAQKFAQYLPSEGFRPVVITGPGSSKGRWTPQDDSLLLSIPPEVSVHRALGPVPGRSRKLLERLETWLAARNGFAKWWIRSATELAASVADGEQFVLATMSPFESGEVAFTLSKALGIPWVADLRDPWALDEMQVYATVLHRRLEMMRMERLLATAALIIMNTPEASAAIKSSFPILRNTPILTIPNGFDRDDFAQLLVPRTDAKFRIVHSGYLHTDAGLQLRRRRFHRLLGGAERGVDILTRSHTFLIEAIERWCSRRPEIRANLEILFAGETSSTDREVAGCSQAASLCQFTGYLPHGDSVQLIRTADLLFLPMHNLPPGKRSRIVPGKVYEYVASGRPILAAVPDGDARDLLGQCGALICRPDDVEGMTQSLDRVYGAWRDKTQETRSPPAVVGQFERRTLTRVLAMALDSVVAGKAAVNLVGTNGNNAWGAG